MPTDKDGTTIYESPEPREAEQPKRGLPPQVPGYRLEEPLGRGSFGEVWRGVQLSSGQTVAVKLLTQTEGLDWSHFYQEVRRLGQVAEHPHVVTLLDANLDHQPAYFVMPCLPGTLASHGGNTSLEQALAWMEQIALALRHMHSRGLLHCDLKPSNIMVDADGRVHVADFGQAIQQGSGSHRLGSLGYMAPEQADPGALPEVAWDLYGLGASLYYLLTGSLPRLDPEQLAQLKSLRTGEERLQRYRQLQRETRLSWKSARVDRDLADLVEACLAIEPTRRPASADEVLQDLDRRRRSQPLLCRRPWSRRYLATRFLKRRALFLSVASLFLVGLLTSMGLLWYREQSALLQAATRQFEKGWALYREGESLLALLWWTSAARLAPNEPAFRFPLGSCDCRMVNMLELRGEVTTLAFTPDRQALLAGTREGAFTLWDWRSGRRQVFREVQSSGDHPGTLPPEPLQTVLLSPKGDLILATGSGGPAQLWRVSDGSHRDLGDRRWNEGDFSSDGRLLLLVGPEGAQVWRVEDARPVTKLLPMPGVVSGRLAPDGSTVALASLDQLVCWELSQPDRPYRTALEQASQGSPAASACLLYHPNGKSLTVVTTSEKVLSVSVPDVDHRRLELPYRHCSHAAYSSDGQKEVAVGSDSDIHLLTKGVPVSVAALPRLGELAGVRFSADGGSFVCWSVSKARVFDAVTGRPLAPPLHDGDQVWCAALSSDGKLLATGDRDGSIRIRQLGGPGPAPRVPLGRLAPGPALDDLFFLPGHARLLTFGGAAGCQLYDAHSGQPVGLPFPMDGLMWSGDGSTLAVTNGQETTVWETTLGRRVKNLSNPDGDYPFPDFQGKRIALFSRVKDAAPVIDIASGKEVGRVPCKGYRNLTFHPAGRRVALAGPHGVAVYDLTLGRVVASYGLPLTPGRIFYTPRGQLVVISDDGATRILRDPDLREQSSCVLSLQGAPGLGHLDPSERWIAVGLEHQRARLLDLGSGQPLLPDLEGQVSCCFEEDGSLLTVAQDGQLSRWDVQPNPDLPVESLWRRTQRWTGLRLEASGIVTHLTPAQWRLLGDGPDASP